MDPRPAHGSHVCRSSLVWAPGILVKNSVRGGVEDFKIYLMWDPLMEKFQLANRSREAGGSTWAILYSQWLQMRPGRDYITH